MINKALSRRKFLALSSAFTTLALLPVSFIRKANAFVSENIPDIAVVKSTNYYNAAIEAVNAVGGMSKFVRKNSKVGLLVNGNFRNEGTYTNPDIAFAVLKMCFDAGAGEIVVMHADRDVYWKKSNYYDTHSDLLSKTTRSAGTKTVKVDRGKVLKEAEMVQEIFEFDTLINVPVSKNHDAMYLTCCMKNMMGLNSRSTNVHFHSEAGNDQQTDNDRLAHCIADISTVRLPDLAIVDSTRFIITNGPHGPGEIQEENKVLAGTDPVALDAYCATFHDYDRGVVLSTEYAAEHGLGQADLSKIRIKEIELS
jgi:uncharacterized protein (DUF362 family)